MTPDNLKHPRSDAKEPLQAKLIFNPSAGRRAASPHLLSEIIEHMQAINILPEVFLAEPENQLEMVASDALQRGIDLIVASGGDGTIDSVMRALVGTTGRLGIIPTGTQNNTARSLGIPLNDIPQAVQILRQGRKLKVDVGLAQCGDRRQWFLEAASVGLVSALYPAADDIQHGDLGRIGDFLATLINSKPAQMHLLLNEGRQQLDTVAHMVLVSNMPYIGAQFKVAPDISFTDSKLDLFVYANLSKLDLIGYAVEASTGIPEDPRIQHIRISSAVIRTDPKMPVMADGVLLGEDTLQVELRRQALNVMAGEPVHASLIARSEAELEKPYGE